MSKLTKSQALIATATTNSEENDSMLSYALLLLVTFSLMTYLFAEVINPWLTKVL